MHRTRIPGYLHHKASGQAFVRLNGRDFYLGPYGSNASKHEYDRLIAEWFANGRRPPGMDRDDTTITQIMAAFLDHADAYYRSADGSPTGEASSFRKALTPLGQLYGTTATKDFSPLALQALQRKYMELGWCRNTINAAIRRVRHVFKWAASREMTSPVVLEGLRTVTGLKRGRSDARESEPVHPVAVDIVEATLPFLPRPVEALVRLQMLTGARPGELLTLRPMDLDMSNKVWMTKSFHHKNSWRDQSRTLYFGPKAQAVLKGFLDRPMDTYLFSPKEAVQDMRDERHADRRTPACSGNTIGTNRVAMPTRTPGDRYDGHAYRRAIARDCDQAFAPPGDLARTPKETIKQWQDRLTTDQKAQLARWQKQHRWHPHQLRHTVATLTRKEFGPDAARALLGHRSLVATAIYAELDQETCQQIVVRIG